jgi:hypothetical protein
MKLTMTLKLTMGMMTSTCFAQQPVKIMAISQMTQLAQIAVYDEVESFNHSLEENGYAEGYSSRLTDHFLNTGKNRIDSKFMNTKCILTEQNIASIFSSTLSNEDDALEFQKMGLASVKSTYNAKIWRLLSQICTRAQNRFIERLSLATQNGTPLALDDQMIAVTSKIVFYPTLFGQATFRNSVSHAFNTLLAGALVIGAGSAMIGIPAGGMILTIVTLVNGAKAVRAQINTQNPFGTRLINGNLTEFQDIKIDQLQEPLISEL